jgi:hypothetical protein
VNYRFDAVTKSFSMEAVRGTAPSQDLYEGPSGTSERSKLSWSKSLCLATDISSNLTGFWPFEKDTRYYKYIRYLS